MALTPSSTSNSGRTELYNTSSGSWEHTTVTDENSLWVHIGVHNTTVTGITFNGDALTEAVESTDGTYRSYWYYVVNPDIGTYSIAVTYAGTGYGAGGAIAFSGTDTSSPLGVTGTATGTGTNPTKTVTSTEDDSYVLQGTYGTGEAQANAVAPGVDETEFYEVNTANYAIMQASRKITTSAGSYGMSETLSVSVTAWAMAVVEVKVKIDPVAYSMETSTHSVTITPVNSAITSARTMFVETLSIIITPIDGILKKCWIMVCSAASIVITPVNSIINSARSIIASAASIVITPISAVVGASYNMVTSALSIIITPVSAFLNSTRSLIGSSASIVITGVSAILKYVTAMLHPFKPKVKIKSYKLTAKSTNIKIKAK